MSAEIIKILKTSAAVAAVLGSWKIYMPRPILLRSTAGIGRIASLLTNYRIRVYGSVDKFEEMKNDLISYGPDPFLFAYDGSYKGNSRLRNIVNLVKVGRADDRAVTRLPIILTEHLLTEELAEELFLIDFEDAMGEVDVWNHLPEPEEFSLIGEKIEELEKEICDEERFLRAGICFLYPDYKRRGRLGDYQALHVLASWLVALDDEAKDSSGIAEMFIERLYKYEENGQKPKLIRLPNVHTDDMKNSSYYFFHDDRFLYISNALFSKIIEPLKQAAGAATVKSVLAAEKILVKGRTKDYTSKMPIVIQDAQISRPRFLRFDLMKLKREGQLDFIEEMEGWTK